MSREHIGTNKYGSSTYKSPETIHPRIKDCKNGYIKVNRDTRRENFDFLIKFLKTHLNIEEIIAIVPYRIAIICSINEFKSEVFNRNSAQHKDIIPYCYITKEGKEENNLPIEPLIYVASDYQTIHEHIFDKGKNLEAVIFFDKYNGAEIISKDIRQG